MAIPSNEDFVLIRDSSKSSNPTCPQHTSPVSNAHSQRGLLQFVGGLVIEYFIGLFDWDSFGWERFDWDSFD